MRTRPSASFAKSCTSGNGSGTKLRARRIYCPTGIAEESPKWNPSEELGRGYESGWLRYGVGTWQHSQKALVYDMDPAIVGLHLLGEARCGRGVEKSGSSCARQGLNVGRYMCK